VKENEATGQNDELERIYALTESLKSDLDAFKKQASEKEMAKGLTFVLLPELCVLGPHCPHGFLQLSDFLSLC
jgi:hypothetical protein